MPELRTKVVQAFGQEYGDTPEVVARAPGRLEMLGNHTDYNEGLVLSVAVDRHAIFAVRAAADAECRVRDIVHNCASAFRVDQLGSPTPGDWSNYIKGIVAELQRRGVVLPAFRATLGSSVPLSAGMSSSAALEIAVAYALGCLAGVELPWQEWARIGQACENEYVGARTGLLDQFSAIKGRRGQLVFSDFRSLEVTNVPLPAETALVIANSMVKHNLTEAYNERRERCEKAVALLARRFPTVRALRDVHPEQLRSMQHAMDPLTFRRACHVVGENERVLAGVKALEAGAVETFGELMFASHESSIRNFENSCRELDLLVEIARDLPGRIGARLSGGGFGGITVHLVYKATATEYGRRLAAAYRARTGIDPEIMLCQAAAGAEVLTRPAVDRGRDPGKPPAVEEKRPCLND